MGLRRSLNSLAQPFGLITRVDTEESVVALTFDDGPDPQSTPELLDCLALRGAKATFFVDGPAALRNPDLLQRMNAEGHAVGVHGWSHASAEHDRSVSGLLHQIAEVRKGARTIAEPTKLYRPPFGHESRWTRPAALLLGYRVVYWSASVLDWEVVASSDLAARISAELRPGAVVLLHDRLRHSADVRSFDRRYLVEAVDIALKGSGEGIRFVTIPQLLKVGRPIVRLRRRSTDPLAPMIEQPV